MQRAILQLLKQEETKTLRWKTVQATLLKNDATLDTSNITKALEKLEQKNKIVREGKTVRFVARLERGNGKETEVPSSSRKRKDEDKETENMRSKKACIVTEEPVVKRHDNEKLSGGEQAAIDRLCSQYTQTDHHHDSSQSPVNHREPWKALMDDRLPTVTEGNNSILLFYAYCDPQMTARQQDDAIAYCYGVLKENGVTGRLRIGREGFNATLTGPSSSVRVFTAALRKYDPKTFGATDFKYVDNQPDNQLLKGLKVFPVKEIVTYGFDPKDAPLDMRGTHLTPTDFHEALEDPNAVLIDVRNFNECLIGRFAPPGPDRLPDGTSKYLDPMMRRSTEFPEWVDNNKHLLEGKKVLMCCTAGVRCERASAFMRNKGVQNVFQLEGGIHRYLDAYPDDGGHWIGKNYVFDKRFSHGAAHPKVDVISTCVHCAKPWHRYNAQKSCIVCKMEVLLCKDCDRAKPPVPKDQLFCPLCKGIDKNKGQGQGKNKDMNKNNSKG